MDFQEFLACSLEADGKWKVNSRERTDLEFKEQGDENAVRKCLKTIAGFANGKGGSIVFGVSDRPRYVTGIEEFMDEADLQNLLLTSIYPVPEIELHEHPIGDHQVFELRVESHPKKPIIAIKDVQTKGAKNKTVLSQGVIYARRAGQTKAISGEEFGALLDARDSQTRNSVLSLLSRAEDIGFDNVAVADFRKYGKADENVTLWVPEVSAKELNIIDRAKLVEDKGAPAYQIRGQIKLTVSSDKDPRKPLLPKKAARVLKEPIQKIFGTWFPWTDHHLRKAATHLGFWNDQKGDNKNTGFETMSERPIYYEDGRVAIQRFANRNPDEFVEVVGSQQTQISWKEMNQPTLNVDGEDA